MRYLSLLALGAGLCATAVAQAGDQCRHSDERSAAAPTAGVEKIRIEAGAGALKVSGEDGATQMMARGQVCGGDEELVAAATIEVRREGEVLIVTTVVPEPREQRGWFGSDSRSVTLDLVVDVPRDVAIEVEDSSGDLEIENVGPLNVADSSGDIRIREIGGPLVVVDSSGEIDIRDVHGGLQLTDSSGDVDVESVGGDVMIPIDSSGDLDLRDIKGSVHIATDTSGDIEIANVREDVRIDVDSSGSIRVDEVGGSFTVEADSSGDIRHSGVAGAVALPPNR